MNNKIRFIDLFAGIGGFHKAVENVCTDYGLESECVFVSEIDSCAKEIYAKNFKYNLSEIINIRDLDEQCSKVPEHDFLFAGFPCQAFSNAGKKMGFMDETRGTLFFDIVKILKNKKPKFILLENVKGLVSHDDGNTWMVINNALKELGYEIPDSPLLVSPHEFGIPQERARVFIPGILKNSSRFNYDYIMNYLNKYKKPIHFRTDNYIESRNNIFEKYLQESVPEKYYLKLDKSNNGLYIEKVLEAWNEFLNNVNTENNKSMPVIWAWELNANMNIEEEWPDWKKKYILEMKSIYINNRDFIDDWLLRYDVLNWKLREQKFEWQAGKDINDIRMSFIQLRQSGIRCKRPTKFPTLVAMVQTSLIYENREKEIKGWRYLTPKETSKLQSFPDNFILYNELYPEKTISDYISYKQLGNSINVYVVSLIIKYIVKNYFLNSGGENVVREEKVSL